MQADMHNVRLVLMHIHQLVGTYDIQAVCRHFRRGLINPDKAIFNLPADQFERQSLAIV